MPDPSVGLSGRSLTALRFLDEHTDPRPKDGPYWAVPKRTVYAFALADLFRKTGDFKPSNRGYQGEVNGAANTLSALKRRGLADNDRGGAWIQARWWVTETGRELARAGDNPSAVAPPRGQSGD